MLVQANLISKLFLENIWVNEVTADINQFRVNLFFSMILNEDFQICPGFGWKTAAVNFKLLWTMKFWNCSKILINDLADFSSTWTGYDAKYFDDCAQSSNAAEVVMYEKELQDANTGIEWSGTQDAKSVKYCIDTIYSDNAKTSLLSGTPDAGIQYSKLAYKTFFNWMVENYPESFE